MLWKEEITPERAPVAQGPETGFWENLFAAERHDAVAGSAISEKYNLATAYDDILKEVNKDLPNRKRLANPYARSLHDPQRGPDWRQRYTPEELEGFIWNHLSASRASDDTAFADLPRSRGDLLEQMNKSVLGTVEEYEDVSGRASGLGKAGAFAGHMFAGVREPANMATLSMGAGAAAGIMRTAIVEGFINGGIELFNQPDIQAYRQKLGLEKEDIWDQVMYGAAGGAAFGGGLKSLGKAIGLLTNKEKVDLFRKTNPNPTKDQEAAAGLLESDQHVSDATPFDPDDIEAEGVHRQKMAETEEALDQGRLPNFDDVEPGPIPRTEAQLPIAQRLAHSKQRISRFLDNSWARITGKEPMGRAAEWTDVSYISDEAASWINKELKSAGATTFEGKKIEDVTGWVFSIEETGLRHWWQRHGKNPQAEMSRGNLPITRADIEQIGNVVTDFDRVTYLGLAQKTNTPQIMLEKKIDGNQVLVVELRSKRKKMMFSTAYKIPADRRPNMKNFRAGTEVPAHGLNRAYMNGPKAHVRNVPAPNQPKDSISQSDVVVTPRGTRIPVKYEVIELDQLITSHGDDLEINPDFPPALQPRDRSGAASQAQVQEIAGNLEPGLLGKSHLASDGAPIVGADDVVEAGNGRTVALRKAYARDEGVSYTQWLKDQGFDVSGLKKPVLIRRRLDNADMDTRAKFARESNERSTMEMRTAERAAVDAANMPDDVLELYQGGDLGLVRNHDFVRAFMETVSPAERGGLASADARLTKAGRERMRAAIAAKAYGDTEILADLLEVDHTLIKSLAGVLLDIAPLWARLRSAAKRGDIDPGMDVNDALLSAVKIVDKARSENRAVRDLVDQIDLLSGETPQQVQRFLRMMFTDAKLEKAASRERLTDTLESFIREAGKNKAGDSLFEGMAALRATEIMDTVLDKRSNILPTQELDPIKATKELDDLTDDLDGLDVEVSRILSEKGDEMVEPEGPTFSSFKDDIDLEETAAIEAELCMKGTE